ncbi:OmpA family protein [Mucilaginibacter sp. PAMB04168]|uniref:OmpA family protein n=1 Tax=Mucilaginibacter sp. PAMB04168 TaxID=3138567 RepID=UPI0031F67C56
MKTNYLKSVILALAMVAMMLPAVAKATEPSKNKKSEAKSPATKIDLRSVKIKNVQFGFDRSAISAETYARLDKVVKLMADNNAAVKLSGHADNKGGYVYNWKLSQARANTVKEYMVSKGADSSRIASTEFGDTKPIASNKTKLGRQQNRRVEIEFVQ